MSIANDHDFGVMIYAGDDEKFGELCSIVITCAHCKGQFEIRDTDLKRMISENRKAIVRNPEEW